MAGGLRSEDKSLAAPRFPRRRSFFAAAVILCFVIQFASPYCKVLTLAADTP
jgi:hypothetical protein